MSRLIDANNLNFEGQNYNKSQMKAILDFIDAQPTAYDVEKVVAELEAEKFDVENCRYDVDLNATIDMAIDILKRGGVK